MRKPKRNNVLVAYTPETNMLDRYTKSDKTLIKTHSAYIKNMEGCTLEEIIEDFIVDPSPELSTTIEESVTT